MSPLPASWDVVALRTETLPPATHTNAAVIGRRRFVVVDPGPTNRREIAGLRRRIEARFEVGDELVAILLTHEHFDHISAVVPLMQWLSDMGRPTGVWAHPLTHAKVELPAGFERRELSDGDLVELGDDTLEAIHTPGHARGHLVFADARRRAVYGGDMVASVGTIIVSPPDGSMADYMHSLNRLDSLNMGVLVPSHGAPILDPHGKIHEYLAHRLMREERVLAALDRSKARDPVALVSDVYPELSVLLYPLAAQSLLAHLLKLGDEEKCARIEGGWVSTSGPSP